MPYEKKGESFCEKCFGIEQSWLVRAYAAGENIPFINNHPGVCPLTRIREKKSCFLLIYKP
jgi:hypothetical protein